MSTNKNMLLTCLCIWYLKLKFLVQIRLNRLTASGVKGQNLFCLAIVIVIGTGDYLTYSAPIFSSVSQCFVVFMQ